jgi:DNA polymerase-1
MAMNEINQQLTANSQQLKMLLQVHDELLFEIKENKVKEYAKKIKEIMENVYKLKIPLKVDLKVGDSWQEMKSL